MVNWLKRAWRSWFDLGKPTLCAECGSPEFTDEIDYAEGLQMAVDIYYKRHVCPLSVPQRGVDLIEGKS
jgi:hypothetical protein